MSEKRNLIDRMFHDSSVLPNNDRVVRRIPISILRKKNMNSAPLNEHKTKSVNDIDLHLLLLSSIRYAMGRQTYVVDEVIRMVKEFGSPATLSVALRDVAERLEFCKGNDELLGSKLYHDKWVDFVAWLQSIDWINYVKERDGSNG